MFGLGLGWPWTPTRTGQGSHVFALLGQSNMIGRAPFDGGGVHPADVRQYGRAGADDGVLVPASVPLQHVDAAAGQMGLDITFAQSWLATRPGTDLVLMPGADGGTSLGSGYWQKGGAGYEDAVARINALMAAEPEAVFAGFLWHQGESDTGNGSYAAQLDQMIADFRADVVAATAETPVVLGQLSPSWVAGNVGREAVQNTISDTPARVDYTAVASAQGLAVLPDGIHLDAPGLRSLGTRYASALAVAASNLGQSQLGPAAPQAIGIIPDQTDLVESPGQTLAPPAAAGIIPDQSDTVGTAGPAAPQAQGSIPDQQDEVSA